ncbi:MAG: hypothetical protein O7A69_05675, partial [SAR324 cluster bacterium]|nr:hypothetical protein [SAR324 cluster bacterium]
MLSARLLPAIIEPTGGGGNETNTKQIGISADCDCCDGRHCELRRGWRRKRRDRQQRKNRLNCGPVTFLGFTAGILRILALDADVLADGATTAPTELGTTDIASPTAGANTYS